MERPARICTLGLLINLFLVSAQAVAQARPEPRMVRVRVAAKPTADALLDLALQAGVSLGGDLGACGGVSRRVRGRMALSAALSELLADGRCTFELSDGGSVIIKRALKPMRPPQLPAVPPPVPVLELVVTAGRRPDLPGRAAFSVSAVGRDQLADGAATDMRNLTSQVAGMTVTNLGAGRDKVLLRGFSDGAFTGQTQSTVGLYLDDVPITYNAPDPDLRLIDLERVEVMRGPQGALYGSGSIGGIVRIVTREPDLYAWSGEVSAATSYTRSASINTDFTATANAPLIHERMALRAVVYREHDGGFINDAIQQRNKINRVTRDGGRLSILTTLTPEWSLRFGLAHQSINNRDTQYATTGLGALTRANQIREPHDNDFDELSSTLEGEGDWGRLVWSTVMVRHQLTSRYDASVAAPLLLSQTGVAAFDETRAIDLSDSEVTWASPSGRRLKWLVGAFASISQIDTRFALSTLRPLTQLRYLENRSDGIGEGALFGEATYSATDRIEMTLGGRLFLSNLKTNSIVDQGSRSRHFADSRDFSGLSPKVSVSYRLSDRLQIYGQLADGFRTGGFNTAGLIGQTFGGGVGQPRRTYDVDRLSSFEVGLKFRAHDDQVRLRASAFFATWSGIQSDQYLPTGLAYTVNVGDGENIGLEAEFAMRLSRGFDLRASLLVDDPRLTRRNPAFPSSGDAGLPGVPGLSGAVGAVYARALSRRIDVKLEAQVSYIGNTHLTFDGVRDLRTSPYATGRLSALVSHDAWSAETFVDNPLDSRANTFAFGDPFQLGHNVARTPLRPRTVGLKLVRRF